MLNQVVSLKKIRSLSVTQQLSFALNTKNDAKFKQCQIDKDIMKR